LAIYVYARATDTLNAAETRFGATQKKIGAAFDKRRLAERKRHTGEKLAAFEGELRGGCEQIAKAVKDLFA